ncbi:MAG: hypothetical protein JO244_00250 [Solirubrobacterales bacterium]|nr:hypothetical protein [Solirubrobacterales bacterium]
MSTSVPPPGYVPPTGYGPGTPRGAGGTPSPTPTKPTAAVGTAAAYAPVAARRRSGRPKLLAGGLGLAGVAALAFLLFGSGSGPLSDPVAQAATVSASSPGYRMNMTVQLNMTGLPSPITATAQGIADLRDHSASMSMAMDFSSVPQVASVLGSGTMRMAMVMNGGVIYVRLPQALTDRLPSLAGKPWVKMDFSKMAGVPGVSSFTSNPTMSDPTQALSYLRAASDSISNQGQQVVDGLLTTHYHAELSLDRLAANVPGPEKDLITQALSKLEQATGLHDLPVDVWVDAHHLVRREFMSLDVHTPRGPELQETVTADLSDYGPQPRPTPPPAGQVQDMSSLVASP